MNLKNLVESRFPSDAKAQGGLAPTPIPRVAMPDAREAAIVRRGEAIASVRALEDQVHHLETLNAELERDLNRCHDKLDLVLEERARYRRDAETYRTQLVALAADMNAVNLLTIRAAKTHSHVLALIKADPDTNYNNDPDADTSYDNEGRTGTEVVEPSQASRRLDEIAAGTDSHMEALRQQLTPEDAGTHSVPGSEGQVRPSGS